MCNHSNWCGGNTTSKNFGQVLCPGTISSR